MKKEEKNTSTTEAPENYEAPAIEGLEVEVEKGFAQSGPGFNGPPSPPWPY